MSKDKALWPTVDEEGGEDAGPGVDEAFDGDGTGAPGGSDPGGEGDAMGLGALVGTGEEGGVDDEWDNQIDKKETPGNLRKLDYSDTDVDPKQAPGDPGGPQEGAEADDPPPPGAAADPSAGDPAPHPEPDPGSDPPDPDGSAFPGIDGATGGEQPRPPTRQSFESAYQSRVQRLEQPQGEQGGDAHENANGAEQTAQDGGGSPADGAQATGGESDGSEPNGPADPGGGSESGSAPGAEAGDPVDLDDSDGDPGGGLLAGIAARLPGGENARKWIRVGGLGIGGAAAFAFAATMVVQSFPGRQEASQSAQATEALFAAPPALPDPFAGLAEAASAETDTAAGTGVPVPTPAAATPPAPVEMGGNLFADPSRPAAGPAALRPAGDEEAGIGSATLEAALIKALEKDSPPPAAGISAEALEALHSELRAVNMGIASLRTETLQRLEALETRQDMLFQAQAASSPEEPQGAEASLAGVGGVPRADAPECDGYQRDFLSGLGTPLQAAVYGDASGRRWVRLVSPLLQRSVRPGDALPAGGRDAVVQIDDEGAYIKVKRPGNGADPCVIPLGA